VEHGSCRSFAAIGAFTTRIHLCNWKMEVVLLRSQGVSHEQIQHICGISKATLYRYLHEYQEGGVECLKALHFPRQESALVTSGRPWKSTSRTAARRRSPPLPPRLKH